MSISDIFIYIVIFIILVLLIKGIIVRIWAFFTPLEFINLTYINERGEKQVKKIKVDNELTELLLQIKSKNSMKRQSDKNAE